MNVPLSIRAACGLSALLVAACGGESETGASDGSNISTSSAGGSSHGGSGGSDCSGQDDVIPPGCFGSPGPVTNGSTASGGAGGTASASTDTTSASSGGSAGVGGAAGSAGAACDPQDVAGEGACGAAFGVFFLGDRCSWVSGCNCVGDDCDHPYENEAACEEAHHECLAPDCAPQDVSYMGGCDPVGVWVFNGIECVGMEGCSCVGSECEATFTSPEACVAAHATCAEQQRSCDDLATTYRNYVRHTACQDDSDCAIVEGLCAAGYGCVHVVNRHWGKAGIDAYTAAWDAAGCPQVDCDCDVPASATCNGGVCQPAK